MTRTTAWIVLFFLALTGSLAIAAPITWINPASSDWNTAANWSPATVPGAGDAVTIDQPGVTVSLDTATTVDSIVLGSTTGSTVTLSLNNQTLSVNASLTVNATGSFTINGGTLVGNTPAAQIIGTIGWTAGALGGTLTLAPSSTLNISGGAGVNDMPGTILTNNGTVNWGSGTIRTGGNPGTSIYNNGLWDAQSDQPMTDAFGGTVGTIFNNTGTFRKSGGAGEFVGSTLFGGSVFFNQLAGVIDVQNGVGTNGLQLAFQGSGSLTGGYITSNQYGLTVLSQGNFNINGTVTGTNTWEDAGNLTGTNVINGALTWIAGNWNGAAFVTITPNSTLLVEGGTGVNDMAGTTVTNNGTVDWINGTIRTGGNPGTLIYNNGLWDAQSDQPMTDAYGGAVGTIFNNTGTFRKSGGAGEFVGNTLFGGNVFFNQLAGVIDVQNGIGTNGLQLAFQGSANLNGGYITTNQYGLTVLSQGSFNINGTATGTNTWEDAGNLVGTNVINGALTWIAGTWDGAASITVTPNSTLIVQGGTGNNDMQSTIVTNNGTVDWVSGTIRAGGNPGTFIYNNNLWDAQSDQTINDAFGGSTGVIFYNTGVFRKSGGAGEFGFNTLFANGVLFNQLAGVIDVQNGTNGLQLAFGGSANLTGGFVTTNQFGLIVLSAGNFNINGTVISTNTWEDAGNLVGNNVIIGALTWVAGNWDAAASVTISPNTTLHMQGGTGNLDMQNTIVTNNGTVSWESGTIRAGGNPGTFIYNNNLWDAQSDETLNDAFGGSTGVIFYNTGVLRKSGGGPEFSNSTIFASGVLLNQLAGVIDVQNGTNGLQLDLQGSANLTGGYITSNQFGLTVLSQGSFNINGTVTGSNTWEDAGNLVGNNVINGALNWIAGDWDNAVITITPNTTLTVAGATGANMDMQNATVTNNGTVLWASGTIRTGGNPGTFIYNNGLWNMLSDQQMNDAFGGSIGTIFYNTGTLRKSGGQSEFTNATVFTGGVLLDQLAGVIDVQNGTNGLELALQGGGNFSGGYITTNQFGLTVLSSGNFNLTGTITGANTWEDTGNLVGTNVIHGGLNWVGGNWDSAVVTIAPNTTLSLTGGTGNLDMQNAIVTNNGTILWTSGVIRSGGNPGTYIYNNGLWNAPNDQTLNNVFGGSIGTVVSNTGTFLKSGTGGGSTAFQGTTAFVNPGTLDIEAGNVQVQGGFTADHGTMRFGLASTTTHGTLSLSTALSVNGTLSIGLLGGFAPALGNSFTLITSSADSSQFQNLNLPTPPTGDAWQVNYNPASVVLEIVTLGASNSQITGAVDDAPTHGVPNINVFAFTTNNPSIYLSTATGPTGLYSLSVTNGNWTVGLSNLTAAGYLPVPDQMTTTSSGQPNQVINFVVQAIGATAPAAVTTAASGLTASGATLNGTVNPNGEAVSVYFEYGTTSLNQVTPTTTLASSLTTAQGVAIPTAGLIPGTLYQFEIVAENSIGTNFGGILTFTTPALGAPPVTVTLPASNIASTNSTVNGTVNPSGLAATYYFEYGTDTNYGTFTVTNPLPAGSTAVAVTNELTNLQPATVYHYQLVAVNAVSNSFGGDLTFTNLSAAPTVVTLIASSVSSSGATLNGSINPNGLSTSWYFEYGTDTNYGTLTAASSLSATNVVLDLSSIISGLNANTVYHFQLVASNTLGTNVGGDLTFATVVGATPPTAVTTSATSVSSGGATLNGTVNPNGQPAQVYFEYGTTALNQFTVTNTLNSNLTTTQPVALPIGGLLPGTQYQFQIVAQDSAGTTPGGIVTFTTPGIGPVVVTLPATGIDSTNATVNGTVNPGGLAATYYFEYGTDTNYGAFTVTNPLPAGTSAVALDNTLTNLQPGTVYHFQLVAANGVSTNVGGDLTFTNLGAAPTVVTLAASSASASGATLNGSVNPNGLSTGWYFEYGTDTNYGTVTPATSLAPTNVVLALSSILSGLNGNTVYHFQLVASNSLGTNFGGDLTFSTSTGSVGATISCPSDITTNEALGLCSQIVAFAPIVTGSPAPTLTCVWNGNPITSPFSFPVGTNLVTCTASNLSGSDTCSFNVIVVDINPPVAGTNSVVTLQGEVTSISVAKILTNDSAPNGGTLSITSVTPTTPNGATVTLGGGLITYAPTSRFIGEESINYTLSDGCGTVPGTITVTVLAAKLPSHNSEALTQNATAFTLIFAGVPGADYLVQYAPSVGGPWLNLPGSPFQAMASGLVQVTDPAAAPTRYYRTQLVSGP